MSSENDDTPCRKSHSADARFCSHLPTHECHKQLYLNMTVCLKLQYRRRFETLAITGEWIHISFHQRAETVGTSESRYASISACACGSTRPLYARMGWLMPRRLAARFAAAAG